MPRPSSAALLAGLVLGAAVAVSPRLDGAETARALLDQARHLNQTTRKWTDRAQRLTLTIIDRRGSERHRELEIFTKRYADDASRAVLFFRSPAEVRGIGFLQWIQPRGPDQQWLYLPELKRVRQISGSSKQESFVGTDFSYEDLAIFNEIIDWTEADAPTTLLGEETIGEQRCAVIGFAPADPDIGYGRIRLWLGREDLVPHQYEFADRKGRPAKTLLVSDIRLLNQIPTAHRLEMRNERSGSRTIVVFTDIRYDTGLPDDLFSQRRLERGA